LLKEENAARLALAQAGPARAAMLSVFAPRGAASGFLELKMRLLNFPCA
jgi:hypothetical protein